MTLRPVTSAVPDPSSIFMPPTSSADSGPAEPTSSAVPLPDRSTGSQPSQPDAEPQGEDQFPEPKLRLELRDLAHPGTKKFLQAINASDVMAEAVANVQRLLYNKPQDPTTNITPTRSVTVILRDMGGVAYTTGTELDDDHKEIHFSLGYINSISDERLAHEITGVLTHELVHCYQWNALGTCPGGLIEGIADWVRLNCDLSPPHWERKPGKDWDAGYQNTGYFLDYLEKRFGAGTVRRINEKLRSYRYEDKPFWTQLLGRPVQQLWGDYVEHVKKEDPKYHGPEDQDGSD
ncbi:PBSP domain-containing protein [Thozetella sp. PMI_491]|nr:PBSP domain-containing protein [Thozetella sp. PMI_491]